MKKYMMVTTETLGKLGACFSNSEEVETFIAQMDDVINEINFLMMLRGRVTNLESAYVVLKQVCILGIFCREHLDLIHQLIRNIDTKEISEEDLKEFTENPEK